MATLKVISNISCKLMIDQEFVCELLPNTLHKETITPGAYLLDIVSAIGTKSFDLSVENDNQQFFKRIVFDENNNVTSTTSDVLRNRSDICFYNGLALVKESNLYGYINSNYEWVVEPTLSKADHFIKNTAIVEKIFNGTTKTSIIDISGNSVIGGWFDEIMFLDQSKIVLRRDKEINIYNAANFELENLFEVCGNIIENEPIPVVSKCCHWGNTAKAGFIDKEGNILLPLIYEMVSNFSESGFAEVQKYGIKRFINKDGKICILNTIQEIEKKDRKFHLLDDEFEWCGKLETSTPESLFLSGCYRLSVLKDGKWGYCYLKEEYSHENRLYKMIPCEYDYPLSDSRFGYVVMKKGRMVCVVNMIDAKYDRGEKKGQYIYGKIGDILFSIEGNELYTFNSISSERVDYGGYGRDKEKYDLGNFVVKRNGKYGIVNKNGIFLTRCEYDDIYTVNSNLAKSHVFTEDICIAERNSVKEIINSKGEILSNVRADLIYKIGNFWAVKPKGSLKFYLFDPKNKELLHAQFEEITYGNYRVDIEGGGYSVLGHDDYIIKNNHLYGVIDKNGKLVLECQYSSISHIGEDWHANTPDVYMVVKNNKHGVFSAEGQQILPCLFDDIQTIPFPGSSAIVGYFPIINSKYGYSTLDGEMVLDCIYDEIIPITSYNEEFAIKKDGKYALMNCNDEVVTDFIYDEIFDEDTDYNESVTKKHNCEYRRTYKVRQGEKIGIINNLGQTLVECKYTFLRRCSTLTSDMKYRYEVGTLEGHGIIVENGKIEVDPIYDSISDLGFYCNSFEVYVVSKGGKKGLMSRYDKEMLTGFEYDKIDIHHDKYYDLTGYSIKNNGKWGFLDQQYNVIVSCQYNSIYPIGNVFENNEIIAFEVTNDQNKTGVLNIKGRIIVPLKYDVVFEEHTSCHQFVCYSNKLNKDKFDSVCEPFIAYDLMENKTYNLETTNMMLLSSELRKLFNDE